MRTSPQMTYTHVIPSPLPVMRTSIPRYTSVADQPRSMAQHITLPTLLIPESGSSSKVSHPASPSSHPHLKLLNNDRPLQTNRQPKLSRPLLLCTIPQFHLSLRRHPRHHHRLRALHAPTRPPVPLRQLPQSRRVLRFFQPGNRERESRSRGRRWQDEEVQGHGDGEREVCGTVLLWGVWEVSFFLFSCRRWVFVLVGVAMLL
jgi:hypothetical protein